MRKLTWREVESSNVSAVTFDPKTHIIGVKFINGGLYTYQGANEEIFMNLLHAPSVGRYLHNVIKAFPYTRWDTEKELLVHLNSITLDQSH